MALKPPPASSEAVRNTMLANRSTDTGPEKAVRRMLREAGHPGYRLHWRIDDEDGRYVCRPDITYPGRKLAIFVHGCFWHRHPGCKYAYTPKSRLDFWLPKLAKNVERDINAQRALEVSGWRVSIIWECQTKNTDTLRTEIQKMINPEVGGQHIATEME